MAGTPKERGGFLAAGRLRSRLAGVLPFLIPQALQHMDSLGWTFGSCLTYKAVPEPGVFEGVAKAQDFDGLDERRWPACAAENGQMAVGMAIDKVIALGRLLAETKPYKHLP